MTYTITESECYSHPYDAASKSERVARIYGDRPLSVHCGVELDKLTRLHHHLRRRTVDILLEAYPSIQLDSLKLTPVHESEGFGGMRRTCPRHGGGVLRRTRRWGSASSWFGLGV
jgi:hypothetical protein